MRRVIASLAAILALGSSQALGQGRPVAEVGVGGGLTVLTDGSTITQFSLPGGGILGGILGPPALYASVFTPSGLFVEPSTVINVVHSSGSTVTTLGLAGTVGRLFHGASRNSPYAGLTGSLEYLSGGGSTTNFAIGGRVGYRSIVAGGNFAVRVEAGYRRWLRYGGASEINVGVALGGVIHSSK